MLGTIHLNSICKAYNCLDSTSPSLINPRVVFQETFQWNGITSKKKGQKWGTEKISYSRRDEYKDLDNEYSEELITEKEIPVNDAIDFDKLPPLPSWPKVCFFVSFIFMLACVLDIFHCLRYTG